MYLLLLNSFATIFYEWSWLPLPFFSPAHHPVAGASTAEPLGIGPGQGPRGLSGTDAAAKWIGMEQAKKKGGTDGKNAMAKWEIYVAERPNEGK